MGFFFYSFFCNLFYYFFFTCFTRLVTRMHDTFCELLFMVIIGFKSRENVCILGTNRWFLNQEMRYYAMEYSCGNKIKLKSIPGVDAIFSHFKISRALELWIYAFWFASSFVVINNMNAINHELTNTMIVTFH